MVAFYVLARQWLVPLMAGLASAVLLAIGFSGTAFNFILPHTDSATFGILCLLLVLLALTRERICWPDWRPAWWRSRAPSSWRWRPEAAAYIVGMWRMSGRAPPWRVAWRMALPAIAVPGPCYGLFAAEAGVSRLVHRKPVASQVPPWGRGTEHNWMPFELGSLFGLIARGAIYCGLLGGLVSSAVGWIRRARGARAA